MTAWRPTSYADGVDGDALKAKRAACRHAIERFVGNRYPECAKCGYVFAAEDWHDFGAMLYAKRRGLPGVSE